MSGPLIGGNIRCFLKLAGTEYFPDLTGKLLLLEACGGGEPQLLTYLSHLEQLGAFRKVSGILLGTFTKLDREKRPGASLGASAKLCSDRASRGPDHFHRPRDGFTGGGDRKQL